MLPNKKILKLSRGGSQSQTNKTSLDDSMDDFLMARPSKLGRRAAKVLPAAKLLNPTNKSESNDEIRKLEGTTSDSDDKEKQNADQQLQINGPRPQESTGKKVRRPRKKAADESDLSLAIALSESLMSANETARKKEEELLVQEDLVEVLSDLRQEETAAGGSLLVPQILPKPQPIPPTTLKRKPKTGKKKADDYVLHRRSQRERERIIAHAAASVLSRGDVADPLRPLDYSFVNSEPLSDYLKQCWHKKRVDSTKTSLWELAGLKDCGTAGTGRETFYVEAMRSFCQSPSEEKKKKEFTGGLFHVSQLPGRAPSQKRNVTASTQDVLEELALKADGGFVEDVTGVADVQHGGHRNAEGGSLAGDWSKLIDNPYLSDVSVLTQDSRIHAHFLVLAVRCPALVADPAKSETPMVIDWSKFSSGAAMAVIRYIYTGELLPATSGCLHGNEVWRIAERCQLSGLMDLINPVFREEYRPELDCSGSVSEIGLSPDPVGREESEVICMEEYRPEMDTLDLGSGEYPAPVNPVLEEGQHVAIEDCRPESNTSGSITEVDASVSPCRAKRSPTPDLFADEEKNKEEEDLIDLTQEESDGCGLDGECNPSGISKSPSLESLPAILNSTHCPPDADEIDADTEPTAGDISDAVDYHNFSVDPDPDPDPDGPTGCKIGRAGSPNLQLLRIDPDPDPDESTCHDRYRDEIADSSHVQLLEIDPDESTGYDRCQNEIGAADSSHVQLLEIDPDESTSRCRKEKVGDTLNASGRIDPDPYRFSYSQSRSNSSVKTSGESSSNHREVLHTPQGSRLAKKRKMDPVTPLPDYQTMPTPSLKKELEKFGLKPLKRKNAVKLLQHIYDELHPMVTDTESSFQETPTQPKASTASHKNKQRSSCSSSGSGSGSGCGDHSSDSEDEQTTIVEEMDQDMEADGGSSGGNESSIPLKDRLKAFLTSRPDIFQRVLSYEPIPFEWLCKEIRKAGIRCKAAQILDWVDEECITCRMKTRNTKRSPAKEAADSVDTSRRACSKKLIP